MRETTRQAIDISNRIWQLRENTGKDPKYFAVRAAKMWEIEIASALDYIRRIESPTHPEILALLFKHRAESLLRHERRIADYLGLLGASSQERRALLYGMGKIQPHFRHLPSRLPFYCAKDHEARKERLDRIVLDVVSMQPDFVKDRSIELLYSSSLPKPTGD